MGSFRDELAADLAEAIGAYEQTCLWRGTPLSCARTTDAAALLSGPGGDEAMISERITVARTALAGRPMPRHGDFLDGYKLQVQKVDPNIGHVILWCGPALNMPQAQH